MLILAEVSDKIPIEGTYWIKGGFFVLFGYLLSRISLVLGSVFVSFLLLIGGVSIYEMCRSDPFWEAVYAEQGISYFVGYLGSLFVPVFVVGASLLTKKERKCRLAAVALLVGGIACGWVLSIIWWRLWMFWGVPSLEFLIGNPGGDGDEYFGRVEGQMFYVCQLLCFVCACWRLRKIESSGKSGLE